MHDTTLAGRSTIEVVGRSRQALGKLVIQTVGKAFCRHEIMLDPVVSSPMVTERQAAVSAVPITAKEAVHSGTSGISARPLAAASAEHG